MFYGAAHLKAHLNKAIGLNQVGGYLMGHIMPHSPVLSVRPSDRIHPYRYQ